MCGHNQLLECCEQQKSCFTSGVLQVFCFAMVEDDKTDAESSSDVDVSLSLDSDSLWLLLPMLSMFLLQTYWRTSLLTGPIWNCLLRRTALLMLE